ncbi:hypothetical protein MTO96_045139, partial [Rhipicephalus appendiculatus]
DLLHAIERYAAGFQSLGVRKGHHVCIHVRTSVDAFVASFALIFAGATVVLCNTSLKHRELVARMSDADATHVLTDPPNAEKIGRVCDQISLSDENRFVLGEAEGFISILGFEHLEDKDFREVAVLDPHNTLAAIAFSSGTGGQVKGVEITHYSFVANMVQNK